MSSDTSIVFGAQPVLTSKRLTLRPFTLADAPKVLTLAGDVRIADTTQNVPHPYEPGMAEEWIGTHTELWASGDRIDYAVCLRESDELIGCVGLNINKRENHAALGYWIGFEFWGAGYTTEAASRLLKYSFKYKGLHRIYAQHLVRNPASGKVMRKLGMQFEGIFRDHAFKNGKYEDVSQYAILSTDW